ncbi:hypothetical protein IWW48_000006 [Coemansia sp. RSA 1200]|nr:hypothetical protein IWW48_000006 [Coemansia sp. RSA 1200]
MVAVQQTPTFNNSIAPIAVYENVTKEAMGVISFLKYISTNRAVRSASIHATEALNTIALDSHCN